MPYKDPEARKQYQREWLAKRRADYLADKTCARCGSTDRLEVDHVDKTKKLSHRVWSWSAARRNAELAKCQVLCYDHHLEKTSAERARPHGTNMYNRHGCRCDICGAAKALSGANTRASRRS